MATKMMQSPADQQRGVPRSALVTGATSGIGREVATALARDGWAVTIAGRDTSKLAEMLRLCGSRSEGLALDFANPVEVGDYAHRRAQNGRPLDLLVCNAGIMAPAARQNGASGHELQLTVNHLSHYVLAARLSPALREAAEPRIVWVTSVRHRAAAATERAPWDPANYDGRASYAMSKAWNLAFALWLDTRLKTDPSGIRSVAAHPGWANTQLQARAASTDGASRRARRQALLTRLLGQSPRRGAVPILAAALDALPDYPVHLGPGGALELWGRHAASAETSGLANDEAFQSWVASKSAELTRTALPV
jgi:NAD(P)-dependent dehydrogenase (short-subunit alcohol dehydrogenase family)